MTTPRAAAPRVQEIIDQLAEGLPTLFTRRERFDQKLAVLDKQLDAWDEPFGARGTHGELLASDEYYDELAALCVGLALLDPVSAICTLAGVLKHLEQQPAFREMHFQGLQRRRDRRSPAAPQISR